MKTVIAGKRSFRQVNEDVRNSFDGNAQTVLLDVNGQRYLGCAMQNGCRLEIHGTPGNDMGSFLDGGTIEVFGNGQEAIGNTMNAGSITVHGHVGDTLGYAMRNGEIFVEKHAGSRAGIHMKEFEEMHPTVVIGGTAGAFLGEYMAGGTLIVLGLYNTLNRSNVGIHCATGMHGGKIFIRGGVPSENVSEHITACAPDSDDLAEIERLVGEYCKRFGADKDEIMSVPFTKLVPTTSRPYANLYTPN